MIWPSGTGFYTAAGMKFGAGLLRGTTMTNFRMAALAIAIAAAMTGTEALAADGALAPGKPAGVQEAQHHGPSLWLIGGVTVAVVAGIVRLTRSSMLDVLDSDYMTMARAKGLSERTVIWKHALRNAMIPIIT